MSKTLIISNSKDELAVAIKQLKQEEALVKAHQAKIDALKDRIKQTGLEKITIYDNDEAIICSISQYVTTRTSWDKEYLEKTLNEEQLTKAKRTTNVANVRITIK